MTWFRLDDTGTFHPKVVAAGNLAWGAFCRAGQWCAKHLTDGKIPADIAHAIAPPRVWEKLARSGLVHSEPHLKSNTSPVSYALHDYLQWNLSAEEVRLGRKRKAKNIRDLRSRRSRLLVASVSGRVTGYEPDTEPAHNRGPDPDPYPYGEEREKPTHEKTLTAESGYDLAWRVWSELWHAKHDGPYQRTIDQGTKGDDRILQRIGALATALGERAEEVLRHKLGQYLSDDGPWLVRNRHPLRSFEADWNKYGEPTIVEAAAPVVVDVQPMTPEQISAARKRLDERSASRAAGREKRERVNAELERKLREIK